MIFVAAQAGERFIDLQQGSQVLIRRQPRAGLTHSGMGTEFHSVKSTRERLAPRSYFTVRRATTNASRSWGVTRIALEIRTWTSSARSQSA